MRTIQNRLRLFTCLTALGLASPAYANNLFLLQLGVFSTQEAASSQYEQVMEEHGKLLKGMRYISKQSRPMSGGESVWRALVGPYESRKLASRACAQLKENGQDCFVVETAAINLDDVESGEKLIAPEEDQKSPSEPEQAKEKAEEEAKGEGEAETKKITDSSWDWFGSDSENEKEESKSDEVVEKPADTTAEHAENARGSNININTHSVYKEKTAAPAVAQIDLVDSLAGLFEGGQTSKDKAEEKAVEAAPAEAASVESASDAPAEKEPETEVKETATNLNTEPAHEDASTTHTGEVEVAEAIPVPLTEPEDVPVTQSAPAAPEPAKQDEESGTETTAKPEESGTKEPAPSPAPAPEIVNPTPTPKLEPVMPLEPVRSTSKRVPLTEYHRDTTTSRVLQVSVFENDRLAFQCLSSIQSNLPASSILRSRIIKSSSGQAVLRLGPVNDPELEAAVCNQAVTCGEQVQCRIIAEREMRQPRQRVRDMAPAQPLERSRRSDAPGFAPMPRNLSPIPPAEASSGASSASAPVWVQLGTSSSESDARSKFETLKSLYPDLLKGYEPTINTPENQSLAGNVYRLRIGTFDDRKKAQSLCASLSARGVGCLVLSK